MTRLHINLGPAKFARPHCKESEIIQKQKQRNNKQWKRIGKREKQEMVITESKEVDRSKNIEIINNESELDREKNKKW